MDYIYNTPNGQKLILYEEKNLISFYKLPFKKNTFPVVLRKDFLDNLSSTYFNETIYFAYHDIKHNIVLDSLYGESRMILVSDIYDYANLKLITYNKNLYLFFIALNPITKQYEIKIMMPYNDKNSLMICKCYDNIFKYDVIILNEKLILIYRENIYIYKQELDFNLYNHENIQSNLETEYISKIENIVKQYNELADYTRQLQEEAKKWKDIYIKSNINNNNK